MMQVAEKMDGAPPAGPPMDEMVHAGQPVYIVNGGTLAPQQLPLGFEVQQFPIDAPEANGFYVQSPATMNGTASSDLAPSSQHGTPGLSPTSQINLHSQLKNQIEYYFSRENLNHDTYLVSQMDADQYVDIAIIASFNQVRKLTSDINLVVDVLRDSLCLQVDDSGRKVRPLHKRSVLVLREIAEGTDQQEIEAIFSNEECPARFASCEQASASCWYLHFETEEQAQAVFAYINDTPLVFKGKRIMARMKARPSATPVLPRPEPRPDSDSINMQQHIRYPVPLPHMPLQAPASTYQYVQASPYGYPPFILSPVVPTYPIYDPAFAATAGRPMDFYPYFPHAGGRGMPQHNNGRPAPPDRKNHSRTNSATSDHGDSGASGASANGMLPKSGLSHTYSSHGRGGYNHHHTGRYGGEKSGRNRGYASANSNSNDNYTAEIPPRHRDMAAAGYKPYKKPVTAAQNATGNQSSTTSASSQHHSQSGNAQQRRSGYSTSRPSNLPPPSSYKTNSAQSPQQQGSTSGSPEQRSSDYRSDKARDSVSSADGESRQSNNKPLTSLQRKSKSPEKEIEVTVLEQESFELSSAAFPALPGAPITASTGDNSNSNSSTSEIVIVSDDKDSSSTTATSPKSLAEPVTRATSNKTKSRPPEPTTLSDIVKGTNRSHNQHVPFNSTHDSHISTNQMKHSSTKGPQAGGANNNHPADAQPASLTNGIHHPAGLSRHPAGPSRHAQAKPVRSSAAPGRQAAGMALSAQKSPTSPPNKNHSSELVSPTLSDKSDDYKPTVNGGGSHSPTDKLSYAAMAQKKAAMNSNRQESTAPPTGDNNNNPDSKPSKPDNLYSVAPASQLPNMMPSTSKKTMTAQQMPPHHNSKSLKSPANGGRSGPVPSTKSSSTSSNSQSNRGS